MTVSLDQLEKFITSVGFPIAMIAVACYALWRCGSFLGREAIIPLVKAGVAFLSLLMKKGIKFLEHQMGCQTRTTEAVEKMCGQLGDIGSTQKQHGDLLNQIAGQHAT